MRTLSKSKLLCLRQCPKRLWLEVHQPNLRKDSASTKASFDLGHQVGKVARQIYDPKGKGTLIDIDTEGISAALARTQSLLAGGKPIFEAGFKVDGALAFADVLLPQKKGGQRVWHMVEVKSSTSVKDYHRDDAAIQAYIARASGLPLASITLAHINNQWTYPDGGDYQGLLTEVDLSHEAFGRDDEVRAWIAQAQTVAARRSAPKINTGAQCTEPFECGFLPHCQSQEPTPPRHSVSVLPHVRTVALKTFIAENPAAGLRQVPDALLNDMQRRVKSATLSRKVYFDQPSAAAALAGHKLPAYFMDFETIQFAVPIWPGTRPYQQIPFQFSVQKLTAKNRVWRHEFLDLSGNDPSRAFAEALIDACGTKPRPIFVYNQGFEKARISELAQRFPDLAGPLAAINARVVDLLPIARDHYYHPSQQGSWSIKAVLPAISPTHSYDQLTGVQDGGMAQTEFLNAIAPATTAERKAEIEQELLNYCELDTTAMIKVWAVFAGHDLGD